MTSIAADGGALGESSRVQVAELQALPSRLLAEALIDLLTKGSVSSEEWMALGLELLRVRRLPEAA